MMLTGETFALTEFSKGAGCGCKIAPKVLEEILAGNQSSSQDLHLLVGNDHHDDAAVYDLGNGTALISTTDFFTPIVDDAYQYGRIAAANAISDVYAMGGQPLMAVAILGWPVDKLPAALAQRVVEGARSICKEAGIALAGGHSIDSQEPIFGLAVTGTVTISRLKKNNGAREGDFLFLTKPIGVGILTTAEKRKLLLPEHDQLAADQMIRLNRLGVQLGSIEGVTAMTDVTGFGLGGHLSEMANGSNTSVELEWNQVKVLDGVKHYLSQRIYPDATSRNWSSYGGSIAFAKGVPVAEAFMLLPDPQTNGGLLFTVREDAVKEVQALMMEKGMGEYVNPIGRVISRKDKTIYVM